MDFFSFALILLFGAISLFFQDAAKVMFNLKYQQPFVISSGLVFMLSILFGVMAYYSYKSMRLAVKEYNEFKMRREEKELEKKLWRKKKRPSR